ncbi:MAG: hypothetical protein GF398_06540 [Chitinivibrionales bacterium]|nr:hypothetical protein [Chitinivibrionales bacterium]
MSVEALTELENKIEQLVQGYQNAKAEADHLRKEVEGKQNSESELHSQIEQLNNEINTLKSEVNSRQEKLDTAAGKVQDILNKIESVN